MQFQIPDFDLLSYVIIILGNTSIEKYFILAVVSLLLQDENPVLPQNALPTVLNYYGWWLLYKKRNRHQVSLGFLIYHIQEMNQ